MARAAHDVTDTELAILEALWDLGPTAVRQLVERLYPDAGPSARATVLKLLERLEAKGVVVREPGSGVHRFSAVIDRATLVSARLRSVAEKLCSGSMASLLTHLVETESLSKEDRRALRAVVERWDSSGAAKSKNTSTDETNG
jgi:BlaI family transcriptional regulator, penicillinase repressor